MKIKNITKMPRLMMEWKEQFMNFPLTTTQFDSSLGSPAGRGNHPMPVDNHPVNFSVVVFFKNKGTHFFVCD